VLEDTQAEVFIPLGLLEPVLEKSRREGWGRTVLQHGQFVSDS